MDRKAAKRKLKDYYINQAKKAKNQRRKLQPGMRGFLCTTNGNQKSCVREAYSLLNQFATQLYGPEQGDKTVEAENGDNDVSLESELAHLRKSSAEKQRRFQEIHCSVNNCVFISTTLDECTPLVAGIMEDIYSTGQQRTRYLTRLLPIDSVCKADESAVRVCCETLIRRHVPEDSATYCVVYKSRHQCGMSQDSVKSVVRDLMYAIRPLIRVDYRSPQLCLIAEGIANHMCLSVVKNFYKYSRFNVIQLANSKQSANQTTDYIAETTDSVAETTDSVADKTDSVTDKTDSVADKTDSVADKTDSVAESTDSVADKTDSVADKTDSVADKMDSVTDKTDSVAETTDSVADKTDSVADKTDSVADKMNSVTDKTDSVAETTDSVADKTDSVADKTDSVADKMNSVTDKTDSVSEKKDSVSEKIELVSDETESVIISTELNSSTAELDTT